MAKKIEVKVPNLGDISDVEIMEIFLSAGDKVNEEDPLLSLETDKAVMEVPSPVTGILSEWLVKTGDRISEGDTIAYIETEEDKGTVTQEPVTKPAAATSLPEERSTTKETTKEGPGTSEPSLAAKATQPAVSAPASMSFPAYQSGSSFHASPSIRKFARELGVDLTGVKGSGPKGRITKEDVKSTVKYHMQSSSSGMGGSAIKGLPTVSIEDFQKYGEVETEKLSRIKKISAGRLQASWQNIPHVTHFDESDITDLEDFRKSLNQQGKEKITPLAFIIKAVVKALQEFPRFNASIDENGENLFLKKYYNIGFAADTPDGLMVPVIADADRKGIKEIALELAELSEAARNKKLDPARMTGGTFTISSLGGIGGTGFTPIINPPEAAIMGVSRSKISPVWDGESFNPRLILPFSLSYDHRIIDGAEAARFCRFISNILQDFRLSSL